MISNEHESYLEVHYLNILLALRYQTLWIFRKISFFSFFYSRVHYITDLKSVLNRSVEKSFETKLFWIFYL